MEEEEARHEKLVDFLEWAAKLGVSDLPCNSQFRNPTSCLGNSLTLSNFPDAGGRGLGAARDLKKGEMVLRVPKSALLTRDSLLKDGLLSSFVNAHPSLSPTQILSVCLLYEMGKGKSSFWYPYLMHLPRSYEILATFSEFEKQAFQIDEAIWTAEKAISKCESEWKEANSLMQELKFKPRFLTLRAWIWASATISSRTLHIPWDEAGCLCPVGDLFNYAAPGEESNSLGNVESLILDSSMHGDSLSFGHSTDNLLEGRSDALLQRLTDGGFNEDLDSYYFYARKNYKRGEQVLLSYGTYTNLELLEHYGFLLNKNPNDKVFILLEPSMYCSSSWPKESMYIHQDGKPSFALLSALRLWATPLNQRRSVGHLAYSGTQLSVENEISVLKWISKNCHKSLATLATKVEEDHTLLTTVDKIKIYSDLTEVEQNSCQFEGEVSAFLEANCKQKGKNGHGLVLSGKTKSSIERWKLAVEWRYGYKKILDDCISYCEELINSISTQNVGPQQYRREELQASLTLKMALNLINWAYQ